MITNPLPDMREADAMLRHDLTAFVSELESRLIPEAVVSGIHSTGYAEDGETLLVMVELADGSTAVISVHPGEPVCVRVVIESSEH